jgi:hypothetical protein
MKAAFYGLQAELRHNPSRWRSMGISESDIGESRISAEGLLAARKKDKGRGFAPIRIRGDRCLSASPKNRLGAESSLGGHEVCDLLHI